MALQKTTPTEFGVDATYWHILAIQVNRVQASVQVTMAGYLDAAARRSGCRPIAVATVSLAGADFPGDDAGIRYDSVYDRLKRPAAGDGTQPFAGAADM
ncbi:MAG TPA: hypothetical protein VD995_09060 [Azospirillum sp.]|nr:hypothetical protein [Azospirillum sp.]